MLRTPLTSTGSWGRSTTILTCSSFAWLAASATASRTTDTRSTGPMSVHAPGSALPEIPAHHHDRHHPSRVGLHRRSHPGDGQEPHRFRDQIPFGRSELTPALGDPELLVREGPVWLGALLGEKAAPHL